MIEIRPVTDLRNKFAEIEQTIQDGKPICLTKNGYGLMVVMSIETYTELTEDIHYISEKLAEADRAAKESDVRYTFEEVFSRLREKYV